MFIGIAGPICAGKRTIADFLIQNHQFTRLRLRRTKSSTSSTFNASTPSSTPDDTLKLANGLQNVQLKGEQPVIGEPIADRESVTNGRATVEEELWFDSMGEMTDYVTKRWRQNFVTVDIWNEEDLDNVAKRPFFLLISVDAPIAIRWKRFSERSALIPASSSSSPPSPYPPLH